MTTPIASGVTDIVGKINCYGALNIGSTLGRKVFRDNFHSIKYSGADRVLSSQTENNHEAVHDTTVLFDRLLLFQIFRGIKRSDDLRAYVNFEQPHYTTAFFMKQE
ncbi:hypothetical protein AVEN_84094-1 [Araneus ventricosus]|uniref:Uncharacterized protein n=1 Tax=Araneus ventricosus TaxID=182803 RepID=A0A4Y2J5P3_ARAVE|nr:hypothetical protein AVEN_84094-1 [Araneus ventricosus]